MESTFSCLSDSDRLEVPRNETTLPSIIDANIPIISRVGTKRTYIRTETRSVYVGRITTNFTSKNFKGLQIPGGGLHMCCQGCKL